MSTYRTHFILNNATPYNIVAISTSNWDKGDFGDDNSVNPGNINGSLEAGGQRDWPLELVEGRKGDPFTLHLDFGDGHWLRLRNMQKQAYDNIGKYEVVPASGDHQLGGLSVNVYRQCQYALPKPDWGNVTISLVHEATDYALNTWMSKLDPSTPISDINLPGTHDSAAISSLPHTPWACQQETIFQQLQGGVRMLDVRIKVKGTAQPFSFVTCHGDFKITSGNNEYQSLPSLLDECKAFLSMNGSETIVLSLKVDDYNDIKNDPARQALAIKDLTSLIMQYPVNIFSDPVRGSHIPTLKEAKGHICLLNRIEPWQQLLGAPLNITDNMTGGYLASLPKERRFDIYCQDKYSWGVWLLPDTPHADKFKLVKEAWNHKKPREVLINFASGVYAISHGSDELFGFYINDMFLNYLGQQTGANRPKDFGWMLFDFALYKYSGYDVVDLIVASNFNYDKYPNEFHVNTSNP